MSPSTWKKAKEKQTYKVSDFDVAFFVEKQIFQFQVAVNNTILQFQNGWKLNWEINVKKREINRSPGASSPKHCRFQLRRSVSVLHWKFAPDSSGKTLHKIVGLISGKFSNQDEISDL